MKTRFFRFLALALLAVASLPLIARAQISPKTVNVVQEVGSDGSVSITMEMSFDALAWKQWKSQVGDDPSRLRAMMKFQFSAYVIDDFKFEKDDLNRTAKMNMRSPAGPELRKDGRFRIAIEKEFRLVNNTGHDWFFSGNNPYANNSLQTVKLKLPVNAFDASLVNAGSGEQGLIYSLKVAPGKSRTFLLAGAIIAAFGALGLVLGFLIKQQPASSGRAAAGA